ncbi:hypothetical protein BJ508DRAFT_415441 [Ascobolus immersus RN42]|uniref:VWFA domain-containing protein n=1 Tax=Ascobolus immersus RN42 TaxID=1160509 RepID=A0A3N4I2Y4_ASCIM|nr:hypothetical protein BJ508DRAFT_415441 [Ascobolus immersus RN42]
MSDSIASSKNMAKNKFLEVVFLLDITGSMGNQIEAMKRMIKEFLASAGDEPTLHMHVWTFTESSKKCYVCKSPANSTNSDLIKYVTKIQLSTPPSAPHDTGAYGGDYEENSVAAVSALLDSFDQNDNIMAFIITDAPPHHVSAGRTPEAEAEKKWLAEQDPSLPMDMFQRLDRIVESLNITFVPINYESHGHVDPFYLQAALLTDGVVLRPTVNDAGLLANGLVTLMHAMQSTIVDGKVNRSEQASAIESLANMFSIVKADPDTWVMFETDPIAPGQLRQEYKTLDGKEGITAGLFGLLETTMDRFTGKRAGKRCRSVDPDTVAAAVRVFVLAMMIKTGFAKDDHKAALDVAQAELARQLEKNVETGKRETFYLNRLLGNLLTTENSVKPSESTSSQCIITLQSAWDTISELEQVPTSVEDVEAWMEIVLQLTLCRLLNIRFPTDAEGKIDFMDAWSASVKNVSYGAPLSAYAAVALRNHSDDGATYLDPSTRETFNSALLLAHPDDPVLSSCYTTLSALPSLQGLVQGYLVSGGLNIFPSITVGLQGSTLLSNLRIIAQANKPNLVVAPVAYEWLRSVVWSLAISDVVPAVDVVKVIENEGTLNPEDNPSKLMTAFIRYMKKVDGKGQDLAKKWKYLYEELVTNSVSFAIRLRDKGEACELIPTDEALISCFIEEPTTYDPLALLHPAETFNAGEALKDVATHEKLRTLVREYPIFKHNRDMLRLFWDLLHQRDLTAVRETDDFPLTDDELVTATVESILLRKRTTRYVLSESKAWVRSTDVSLEGPLADLVKKGYVSRIGSWKTLRAEHARAKLLQALEKKAHGTNEVVKESTWNNLLKNTVFTLHDQTYSLTRMDAPTMLSCVPDQHISTLGAAIVRGTWTSGPPSQLRRHTAAILPLFSNNSTLQTEIQTAINSQAICSRELVNRHGHTVKNTYPGFTGWNQDYNDVRLATKKPDVATKLATMKKYKLYLDEVMPQIEKLESQLLRELASMVVWLPDYNSATKCMKETKYILENGGKCDLTKVADYKKKVEKSGTKKVGQTWWRCEA